MTDQAKTKGVKHHLHRSWRLALAISLSLASVVAFLIYQYDRTVYDHLSFWQVRWPVFVLVFIVCFAVIWYRARRRGTSG